MAYSQEDKDNLVVFPKVVNKEHYRVDNAKKTNKDKKPDGYIYILQNKHFDLIKIGVSANPKRRIRDIKSYVPFELDCVFLKWYEDVYGLETLVDETFIKNKVKGEWYQVYKDDVLELIEILNSIE